MELSEVVDATLRGFSKAQKQYDKLSGGWELCWAPEYLATVNIAEQVYKVASYVTIEQNIEEALHGAGRRKDAPAADLPTRGRFDLVVWEGDGVKGIIEVKMTRYMTYGTVKGDVVRVGEALGRANNLEWGLVAYHNTVWDGSGKRPKPASERIKARSGSIKRRAKAHAADNGLCCTHYLGDLSQGHALAHRAEVLAFTIA